MSNIRYEDYLFTLDNLQSVTTRRQDEVEDEPNSEYSLIYKKNFGKEGHELTAEAKYLNYWEHSDQLFTQHSYFPDGTEDVSKSQVQHSLNDEYENQWLFQLDYVQPFGKDGKFEAGVRSSFRDMVNDYVVSEQNASGEFEPLLNGPTAWQQALDRPGTVTLALAEGDHTFSSAALRSQVITWALEWLGRR